jgi:hypothetical protein
MKHLYTLLFAMLTVSFAFAQAPVREYAGRAITARAAQGTHVDYTRDIIYTNDFSDCSNITFTNANDAGFTDYIDGINWECTTAAPSGPYAIAGISSTTADNGFVMVDSDLFGAEEAYAASWIENCWFNIDDPVDLTGHDFVTVEFENYYRCWDNTTDVERCYMEISLDGVNWPSAETLEIEDGYVVVADDTVAARYEVFPTYERADESTNPYVARFDIGDIAGGEATVYFRWRWVGQWGYAWMVDDMVVFDTPANDVRINDYVSFTDFLTTGLWEAQTWPESQLPVFDLAVGVTGLGTVVQPNTMLTVAVNGNEADGGMSTTLDIAYGQNDTLRVLGWEAPGVGEYTFDYTVASDSTDEYPADNAAQQAIEVVELQYGRENGEFVGQTPADGTVDFIAGVPYDAVNDMTIYAIDVAIMDGSDVGAEVVCHLFDWVEWNNGGGQYDGLLTTTEEVQLEANFLNSGDGEVSWYTFALEEPYEVAQGEAVMACFEHLGGDNVQIGTSVPQRDQTVFIYGPFGASSAYDWFFTTNCPMVRLNLDPNAETTMSVEDIAGEGFTLGRAYPNPAAGNTRIDFTLEAAADVTLEVTSMTGAIVRSMDLGVQPAGNQRAVLDLEGLTAGMYTYTISVDGARATRKLIVK